MSFWITAVGGLLLAVSEFYNPHQVVAILGLVLFAAGVVLLLSRSVADAPRDGVGFGPAAARAVKRALRFAWAMMP